MTSAAPALVIDGSGFATLLDVLRADGREVLGPTVRDGAIALAPLASIDDLPRGVGDEQAPGHYRLRTRDDAAWFGYAVGPQGARRALFPPVLPLVQIRRRDRQLAIEPATPPVPRRALVGVRPCELAALAIHDRVFTDGPHVDADYAARRAATFVVAVHCGAPAATCFCASMGTGPRAAAGFDLAATELCDGAHRFVIEIGSAAGQAVMAQVPARPATPADLAAVRAVTDAAAAAMARAIAPAGLRDELLAALEHPRWQEVAARCLGCASCTLVCPTCFCTTIDDGVDLAGEVAIRTRRWDSCLTAGFAYVHGGSARPSLAARYRQWLTHKLATWHDQFGTAGCVGCGRCITWCPVGIDLTAEVAALRVAPAGRHADG